MSTTKDATQNNNPQDEKTVTLHYRKDTSDEKAIQEVWKQHAYRHTFVTPEANDVWLDVGANIGATTLWLLAHGVQRVISVEPHPTNMALLKRNVSANCQEARTVPVQKAVVWQLPENEGDRVLYLSNSEYRHTVRRTRGRKTLPVEFMRFSDLLARFPDATALKMDIESAEHGILTHCSDWGNVRKMAFEYHFIDDFDSWERFHETMRVLESRGWEIDYKNKGMVPLTGKPNFFPRDLVVFARRGNK